MITRKQIDKALKGELRFANQLQEFNFNFQKSVKQLQKQIEKLSKEKEDLLSKYGKNLDPKPSRSPHNI